jgi:Ca-activated chloride channel family protein
MTWTLPLLDEKAVTDFAGPDGPAGEDSGFGALATGRGHLPLEAMDVRARVDGLLAQVTVSQTFVNPTDEPLEATYIFPLPDRAAVTGFRMEVAGRVVEGRLDERGRARETYDKAVETGQRAAIAEEERPGVFTLRVGNLMPGERAAVRLTTAGVLPYADGEVTFRFPLVVAPRYVPGLPLPGPAVGEGVAPDTDAAPDASRISPPVLLPGFPNPVRLSIAVDLHGLVVEPRNGGVRVSLHAAWVEAEGGVCRVTLQPGLGERLDRDFVLRFRLGGPAVRTSLSFHPDADREGTFALTVIPPADPGQAAQRPRDVAFVLDRSGSMEGWKIVAARRALAQMVDTLGPADRFHVAAFDTGTETPPGQVGRLVAATARNRAIAAGFLDRVGARGGTEMAGPLAESARLLAEGGHEGDGRDRVLVLITDGQVANEDQILRTLKPLVAGARVFALGVDRAVNEGFLNRLAGLGGRGGGCELVETEERLDAVTESVHRRIGAPVLTDLALEPQGWEVVPDTRVPERSPAVFAGAPLLVLGRYRGVPGPVTLRAAVAKGAAWSETVAPAVRENPAVAAAWARGQVRKLEDRYVTTLAGRDAIERAIVATSLKYGVLSRFTAYVAVDTAEAVNPGGEVHRVTQPVPMPQGWADVEPLRAFAAAAPGIPRVARRGGRMRSAAPGASFSDLLGSALGRLRSPSGPARVAGPGPMSPGQAPPPGELGPLEDTSECCFDIEAFSVADSVASAAPGGGDPLAGFEQVRTIGAGGSGTVYRAYDRGLGKDVGVKVTPDRGPADAPLPAEDVALLALNHPSIVRSLDVARKGGMIVRVFELAEGRPLDELARSADRPGPVDAARLVLQLAEALDHAHSRGVVHGDVKAGNVFVGPDAVPRLLGFAEAAPQAVGVVGNPAYAAPELLDGTGKPSPLSDIYSLGIVLYLLLTGRLPYTGGGHEQLQRTLRGDAAPPRAVNPAVPEALDAVCRKAMARRPEDRYPSAAAMAGDLRRFLDGTDTDPAGSDKGRRRGSFWK